MSASFAPTNLVVRAGRVATERLRAEGFHADLFSTLVGASGGPKWLVLRHLDDALIDGLVSPRSTPLDTIGSSIGSYRHACYAQSNPKAALTRLHSGYVGQRYAGPGQPTMEEVSKESDRILANLLGSDGAREIAENTTIRSHFIAARLRRDHGLDRGPRFKVQLASAALRNALSRRRLGYSFERILFRPGKTAVGFDDLPTIEYRLEEDRVQPAILAGGSIPLVMAGVRGTPRVPGVLFDGGIVDYHFDFEFRRRSGLVLFHFFDRIVPGWLDKPLRWRRPRSEALEDVVLLAPSNEFVASLPGGRVPDRNDFLEFETDERIRRWETIVERCRCLAEEFEELLEDDRMIDAIVPFDGD